MAASSELRRRARLITYGGAPMYVSDLKRALEIWATNYQLYGQGESPMTITRPRPGRPRR